MLVLVAAKHRVPVALHARAPAPYTSPVRCAHLMAVFHPQLPAAFTDANIFEGDWDMPGLSTLAAKLEEAAVS